MNRLDNFQEQFAFGQSKEEQILSIFRHAGWIGDLFDFRSFGDLWVIKDKIPYVIEVKNEDRYAKSKNICIELYQGRPKGPSGLSICESQVCLHTFITKAILYRTNFMRIYIKKHWKHLNIADFNKADNFNGGLIYPKLRLIEKPWYEYCAIREIPNSKIFIWAG